MYGRTFHGPLRSAWILDGKGKVLAVIEKVDAKAHGRQVLAALDAL
jgi:peroxiredoxin